MPPLKKKILFHMPVKLKPLYYGTQGRILGILTYFKDREDYLSVDIVAANQSLKESYITPIWNDEQTQEALNFVENVFVYEGKYNLFDFFYTRSKIFYYQIILGEQLPVDTDYYTPPGYVNFIQSLSTRKAYDFAWINTVNFTGLAKPFKSSSTHTIVDTHDICSRLRQMLKDVLNFKDLKFDYEVNFAKEVNSLNSFDTVISDSNYEFSVLANHLSKSKLISIPHLVNSIDFCLEKHPYEERTFLYDLLFVGMANTQNVDGIKFFIDAIFPQILKTKPTAKLAICGKICNDLQIDSSLIKNIDLLGYVPDLSKLYLQSRLMICPLRTGAGTNVKLIEAMSYSLPIVTTQRCASAISIENEVNAFITDDPVRFAHYTTQLLTDFQIARVISEAVHTTYAQQYSKSAVYAKLDSLFGINP